MPVDTGRSSIARTTLAPASSAVSPRTAPYSPDGTTMSVCTSPKRMFVQVTVPHSSRARTRPNASRADFDAM